MDHHAHSTDASPPIGSTPRAGPEVSVAWRLAGQSPPDHPFGIESHLIGWPSLGEWRFWAADGTAHDHEESSGHVRTASRHAADSC